MSQIGGPIQSGLAGGVPAQEIAGKARAKRDRERNERTRRFEDAVDLTVPGMETSEAIHGLSEHDEQDRQRQQRETGQQAETDKSAPDAAPDGPHIDLRG